MTSHYFDTANTIKDYQHKKNNVYVNKKIDRIKREEIMLNIMINYDSIYVKRNNTTCRHICSDIKKNNTPSGY